MNLNFNDFSTKYTVRPLAEDDIPEVLELCKANRVYYEHYKAEPTIQALLDDLVALPPNKALADKYFVGFYEGDKLIALLDVIDGYPTEDVAYIGWFMLDISKQGHREGTAIITQVLAYLSQKFAYVELAYIKGNPQAEHFWEANGFSPIGDEVIEERFSLIKMGKRL